MEKRTIKKMKSKNEIVYAFIDSQNLNLSIRNDIKRKRKLIYKGWKLDFKRFHTYLIDKYKVNQAFLFIGYIPEYEDLYKALKNYGYKLIFKPTIKDNNGKPKGNVDAEIVLHASTIEYDNYDKAVIISGDGDFNCLIEFLIQRKKLGKLLIPNQFSYSSLLTKHKKYISFCNQAKNKLERNKKRI